MRQQGRLFFRILLEYGVNLARMGRISSSSESPCAGDRAFRMGIKMGESRSSVGCLSASC